MRGHPPPNPQVAAMIEVPEAVLDALIARQATRPKCVRALS